VHMTSPGKSSGKGQVDIETALKCKGISKGSYESAAMVTNKRNIKVKIQVEMGI